jgi:hypothetical protein
MSYHEKPTRPLRWQWMLFVPMLVIVALAVALCVRPATASVDVSPPWMAAEVECDPAVSRCVSVEYLDYRGTAVGSVYVDGKLSHCKGGFCIVGEPYAEIAPYRTPAALNVAVGCPDVQDAIEALAIVQEWQAAGSSEARMGLVMGERSCTTMSTASYYQLPPMTIYASGGYSYGGLGVAARGEANSRDSGGRGAAWSQFFYVFNLIDAFLQGVLDFAGSYLYPGAGDGSVLGGGGPFGLIAGTNIVRLPQPATQAKTMNADTVLLWLEDALGNVVSYGSSSSYKLPSGKMLSHNWTTPDNAANLADYAKMLNQFKMNEGAHVVRGTAGEFAARSGLSAVSGGTFLP